MNGDSNCVDDRLFRILNGAAANRIHSACVKSEVVIGNNGMHRNVGDDFGAKDKVAHLVGK